MIANDVKFLCIDDGPMNFAYVDSVTGLPNLARIRPAITRAFEEAAAREVTAALAIVSLDRFHVVDERFGRSIADDILREVAQLLRAQAAQFPFAARVGTDEFMIAMPNLVDGQEASVLVHQLLAAVAVPRRIDGHGLRLRGSAGIALYPVDGRNLEDLFRKAGAALADAQRLAPGTLRFHSGHVAAHALARARLRNGLRDALHHEQLTLHYQPQFEVGSGALCGVEALARWTPPAGAPVPPAVFVPLAEQTGLIGALGSWALRTGCRESAPWQLADQDAPTVAVNVSPHQICAAFTADIESALADSGLEPQRLELEITESVLVANLDQTRKCLSAWKSLGVRVALDDFGSGYANFGYLAHLPIDRLKIDRSLTRGLANGVKDATIIRAVIALGRELGFTVLAEGVETEEQLSMLREYGCQQAQGFLFARPAPAAAMPAVMGRRWGGAALAAGAGRTLQ